MEIDDISEYVPDHAVKDIELYEKSSRCVQSRRKKPFPSNEDVVEALMAVSGGTISRSNIETLYEEVKRFLEDKGFDTRFLTEGRFWRLVTNLAKKGVVKLRGLDLEA